MEKQTVIVSFSSKKGGNCEQISDFIRNQYKSVKMYRFIDFSIHPCGGCQYECFGDNRDCPHIKDMEYELLDMISKAQKAYFVVPNYCDYPCAHFFIFNERSQCFFQGHPERLETYLNVRKKFVVVSNSRSDHFREAFTQHCIEEPDILYLSARKFCKSSIDGDLMNADEAKRELLRFIADF